MNWEGYEVEGQMDISEFLDDKGASMTENEIKNTKKWFEDFIETYALSNQETIEFKKAVACLEEIQQYRAIGTIEEFKALKEKNEPKKPIALDQWGEYWKCPACGKYAVNDLGCKYKYCPNCGTEFDWE